MDVRKFYNTTKYTREISNNGLDSEDDLSDNEDSPQMCPPENIIIPETDESSSDEEIEVRNAPSTSTAKQCVWRKREMCKSPDDVAFLGCEDLPKAFEDIDTPVQYFKYFFHHDLLEQMVLESRLYSTNQRPGKPINLTKNELEQFIGICLLMSIVKLPSSRHHWNPDLGNPLIRETMTCNRWEEIKRFLHFVDNSTISSRNSPDFDPLHKIRPILSGIRDRCLTIPKEEFLAVDEQIIPTKTRTSRIIQYNPKKPHKWGYKMFVLSGISGFSYDFDLYSGSHNFTKLPGDAPNLGASSNVVVRLASTIPPSMNFKLFFDNWFTSVPLLVYLAKKRHMVTRNCKSE